MILNKHEKHPYCTMCWTHLRSQLYIFPMGQLMKNINIRKTQQHAVHKTQVCNRKTFPSYTFLPDIHLSWLCFYCFILFFYTGVAFSSGWLSLCLFLFFFLKKPKKHAFCWRILFWRSCCRTTRTRLCVTMNTTPCWTTRRRKSWARRTARQLGPSTKQRKR